MANNVTKYLLPIELDDKKRTLSYELKHIEMLENKFGTLQKAFDALNTQKTAAIRYFLWTGLLHEDNELTEEYVDSLVNFYNREYVYIQIVYAVNGTLPDDEKK